MHEYVAKLKNLLETNADPAAAAPMAAYMRGQFPYLGIKVPQSRLLQRQFIRQEGLPALDSLETVVLELWELPEREFQYAALGLLGRFEKLLPPEFINCLQTLIVTRSWWDTVDSLAAGPVGMQFSRFPRVREERLPLWRESQNIWLRRTCILFQLHYGIKTDFPLLTRIIQENLGSKEFFINKAIGWSLRQYSKVDADRVRNFVAKTQLHPLSAREALKWLDRKASA